MGHHKGAPMPAGLRHQLRARSHPARSVPCPHETCHARAHRAMRELCGAFSTRPLMRTTQDWWARTVACCPDCQVDPGTPCHDNGRALVDVHPRRIQEAKETLA